MAKATPTCRSARLLPVFLLALVLLPAPPLHAQIEWTPEEQISLDDVYDDWFPRIAAGLDGRVWVVWRGIDGYDPEIMYSVNDGNGWSYPDRVNTDDYAEDTLPDIAVGPDGNPWVVWGKRVGGSSKLYWSRWEGDGWRPEERVFPALGEEEPSAVASMATENEGTPWVAWSWPGPGTGRMACCSRWQNGAWGPPDTLLASLGAAGCLLAGGPDGRMWAVVSQTVGGEKTIFCTYWQEGVWAPADTLPDTLGAMSLAVTAQGAVWLVWHKDGEVWAASYVEGQWGEPEVVSAPDSAGTGIGSIRAGGPDLGVSADGLVWVTWKEYYFGVGESNPIVYASRRGPSSWTSKEMVSSGDGFVEGYNHIAISSSGAAWVVWQAWDGRDFEVLLSHSIGRAIREGPETREMGPRITWAPNPIRGWGVSEVSCPAEVEGPILIYDVSGHLVRRVDVRSGSDPGNRTGMAVGRWNAADQSGKPVPSGTYVGQTQAGGQTYEGRMVVIR